MPKVKVVEKPSKYTLRQALERIWNSRGIAFPLDIAGWRTGYSATSHIIPYVLPVKGGKQA